MLDLMIDLETMGTGDNAAIIAIGACFFNRNTGEIGEKFYSQISLQSAVNLGMEIDPSTVLWWMQQENDARSKFFDNEKAKDAIVVAGDFVNFVNKVYNVKPWGNGATFDITKVENLIRKSGFIVPWAFWNIRDVRTVVDLCDCREDVAFEGVPHYALDDAIHQVKYVSAAIRKLTGN